MKLFIDTATNYLIVGVFKDNFKDLIVKEGHNDHSKTLMVEIEKILKKNSLKIDDIEKIIIGVGPGSYTGVRIGLTVAKVFSIFKKIPLYKVSTLAVLATKTDGRIGVMINAHRERVFSAVYENNKVVIEEKIRNTKEFLNICKDFAVITVENIDLDLNKLITEEVLDVHKLSPNYLREWGE